MSVDCAEPMRAAAKLLSAEPILLQPLAVGRFLGHVRTRSTYAPNLDRGPDGDQGEAPAPLIGRVLHLNRDAHRPEPPARAAVQQPQAALATPADQEEWALEARPPKWP